MHLHVRCIYIKQMHLDKQMIQNRGIRVEAETLQNKLLRVVDQIELKLSQIPSMVKIEFELEKVSIYHPTWCMVIDH